MSSIKHIWFDFSDTITTFDEDVHARMVDEAYASITGKPVSPELRDEFYTLFEKHKSYSGTFVALGQNSTFWSDKIMEAGAALVKLKDPDAPEILRELSKMLPISLWSNIEAQKLFPILGIDAAWFTNILGPNEVKKPKPALDGFYLLIERSGISPQEILFVGDSLNKEIRPAKSLGIQTGLIWSESEEADFCFKNFKEILAVI